MSQTKTWSMIEVSAATVTGLFVNVALGRYLYPLFGYSLTLGDNVELTLIFAGVSLFIKYGFRRYFNWKHKREE